jgi:hypothetical protein
VRWLHLLLGCLADFLCLNPPMNFPLQLRFKIFAIAPQISVTDASGALVLYINQRAFKLKEAVSVFADRAQNQPLYTIAADRVLDFNAQYHFSSASGARLGAVRRHGARSLFKAHYEILRGGATALRIHEANPWMKVLDGVFGDIPVLGLFAGYFFHPAYLVTRVDGAPVLRLKKQPAFLEGKYEIRALDAMDETDTQLAVLGLVMIVLLERRRG